MERVMRRTAACGASAGKIMFMMLWFFFSIRYARVHPLDGGYFRLRFRTDRRPSLPRENPLVFYPRYLGKLIYDHFWMGYWLARMGIVRQRIKADPAAKHYTDLALTAPEREEFADLALFGATRGGDQAVAKRRKEDAARAALRAAAE